MESISTSVSPSNLFRYFVEALENPAAPLWCGPSVSYSVLALDLLKPANLTQSLYEHHEFWSTGIKFLTLKRTAEEVRALDASWSRCRCDTVGNALASSVHGLCRQRGDQELGDTISLLIRPFFGLYQKVDSTKVARGSRPDQWPTSPLDIMPFGTIVQKPSVC